MSFCAMVWLTVALVLPKQSVAVQVLVVVVNPQISVVVVSTNVIVGEASQSSVAFGGVNAKLSLQLMVKSDPWPDKTGGMVSAFVIVWLTDVLELPEQSTAVHVLVVVVSPHALEMFVST